MTNKYFENITKKASTTFYLCALTFPKQVRNDVFILYSYVRVTDDFVDQIPSDLKSFNNIYTLSKAAYQGKTTNNIIVDSFFDLVKRKKIPFTLVDDFFNGQKMDLKINKYQTFEDLDKFLYGVAGVIGLLMAYVLELSEKSHASAVLLGKAMQMVNIIRDIPQDLLLNRTYIPQQDLKKFNLPPQLSKKTAQEKSCEFEKLIKFECRKILNMIDMAKQGFKYIPKEYILPIATSADLYDMLAHKFASQPQIIYKKKLKPNKLQIFASVFKNYIHKYQ